MSSRKLYSVILALFFLAGLPAMAGAADVLYLNSYAPGDIWGDAIASSVKQGMDRYAPQAHLYAEYLDSRQSEEPEYYEILARMLAVKYHQKRFSCLIVSDDSALSFARAHASRFAPGAPVVFCGINNFQQETIQQIPVTGIVEVLDFSKNLELIKRIFPLIDQVFVLSDESGTGLANEEILQRQLSETDTNLKIRILRVYDEDSLGELFRREENYAVMILACRKTGFHEARDVQQAAGIIASLSSGPVFVSWDVFVSGGVFGGHVVSAKRQGESAAFMVSEILAGKRVDAIPVVAEDSNEYLFDGRALQHFAVERYALPVESRILPVSHGILTGHPGPSAFFIVAGLVLLVLVIVLVVLLFRKRLTTAEILKANGLMRTLLDTIPVPVFAKDLRFRYILGNKAFEEFIGMKRDGFLGKSVFEVSPPDLARIYHRADRELLASGNVQVYESDVQGAQGNRRNVRFYKTIYKSENGNLGGLVGSILDVTDLRESEKRYRSLFENMVHGFAFHRIVLDDNGNPCDYIFLEVNHVFEEQTGLKASDINGRSLREILPGVAGENFRWIETYGRVALGGEPVSFEQYSDSIGKWFRISVYSPRRNYFVTLSDDITGLKTLEQDSELILDLSSDLFAVIGYDGAIHALSTDNWQHVFGRIPGSQGPERFERIIIDDDRSTAVDRFETLLRGDADLAEFEARSEIAGTPRWFSWSCRKAGSRSLVYATLHDIDSRMDMEQNLRQARDDAQMAVAARGRFLANMSHEIRTPLNAIISMIDLAMLTDCSPRQLDYLITAKESSHHLLAVLNDMLDLVRIDQGRFELEREQFELKSLCESISNLVRFSVEQKGLRYKFSYNGPDPLVYSDAACLRRVLTNLLGNAIKFTEEGEITFDVSVATENNGYRASFRIADTGIGIAENKQSLIFDRFAQVDESLTRKYGGTGLGLAISKQLVQMLGGEIILQSVEGQGSTFSFSVLLRSETGGESDNSVEQVSCEQKNSCADGLVILLAEDNVINNRIASMVLCKIGHTVLSAENGKVALEIFRENQVDLILMDLEMPEMDGIEATERLRAGECGEHGRAVPIVAMTAHVLPEIQERCRQVGMDGYIGKPIDITTLGPYIKEIVAVKNSESSS